MQCLTVVIFLPEYYLNSEFICNFKWSAFFIDLEWKIIYVGSAESEDYDQTLDTVVVGPVIAGRHMFVFEVSLQAYV